jgi:hypothetical protein
MAGGGGTSTHAGGLDGDAAVEVLALGLADLVDGRRLEAVELAKGGDLETEEGGNSNGSG